MWPDGSFWVEEERIVEELQVLVVARHQGSGLRLLNLLLHLLLLRLAQSSDVSAVYPSRVPTLELRQQPCVLVVGGNVHLAQDALLLLLFIRVLHLEVGRISGDRRAKTILSDAA